MSFDPIEVAATAMGVAYVLLAVRRSRWCWLFGGFASAGIAWLAAQRAVPMQAALNAFYVAMAVYGFWRWGREQEAGKVRVGWWPWHWHLVAIAAIALVTLVASPWVAQALQSAHPRLDTACTAGSLLATWLAARARIENWLYWIVVDAALAVLFARQGLQLVAGLYAFYLVLAAIGFRTWWRESRT